MFSRTLLLSETPSDTPEIPEGLKAPDIPQRLGIHWWFYPPEIAEGLKAPDIPQRLVDETLACAWEYVRCVIPHWTKGRYVAFSRLVVITVIAEFKGELVQMQRSHDILGYNVQELLDTLFRGKPGYAAIEKNSKSRTHSELFRHYVNAIASAPRSWFRLRDCDGPGHWTIAAALGCNDMDDAWFSESEWQILLELGLTMYDAVAFYKQRAEGETNKTFAYVSPELRTEAYRMAREVLWALDAAQATEPAWRIVLNFLRIFGGALHMTMRRYRFVEQSLTVGMPENARVVEETRQNVKSWNRIDGKEATARAWDDTSYLRALAAEDEVMFEGFGDLLRQGSAHACEDYSENPVLYGRCISSPASASARREWDAYVRAFPARAVDVFPILQPLPQVRRG
ncbi:hypothetical protein C8R45DRAFT_1100107 [Mycena sanguinolenta]|nr:hypothetical protein C8R45DRAFT_1100107 [Mycena sanguinolenta]